MLTETRRDELVSAGIAGRRKAFRAGAGYGIIWPAAWGANLDGGAFPEIRGTGRI